MSDLNRCEFIGRLGADPEVRTTPSGAITASLRLAVSETWKDQQGQRQERTEWVNLVLWRQQAEIAQKYLRKGSKVYVEGKLETRSWEDKNGGGKRYATEVIVGELVMLDPPSGNGGGQGGGAARSQGGAPDFGDDFTPANAAPADDDSLPF